MPFEMNHRVARVAFDKRSILLKFLEVFDNTRSRQSLVHMIKTGLFAKTLENANEFGTVSLSMESQPGEICDFQHVIMSS